MGDRYNNYNRYNSSNRDFDRSYDSRTVSQSESWSRKPSYTYNSDPQATYQRYENSDQYPQDSDYKRDYSQNNSAYSRNRETNYPPQSSSNYPDKYSSERRINTNYSEKYDQDSRENSRYPPRYERDSRDDPISSDRYQDSGRSRGNYGQERNYSQSQRRPQEYYKSNEYQQYGQENQAEPYPGRNWSSTDTGPSKSNINYSQFSTNEKNNVQPYNSSSFRPQDRYDDSSFYSQKSRRLPNSFNNRYYESNARNVEAGAQLQRNVSLSTQDYDNYLIGNASSNLHYKNQDSSYPSHDQQYGQGRNAPIFDSNEDQLPQHKGRFKGFKMNFKGKRGRMGLNKKGKIKMKRQKKSNKNKGMQNNAAGPNGNVKKQKNQNNKRPREDDGDDDEDDNDELSDEIAQKKKMLKFETVKTLEDQINHVKARSTPLSDMPYEKQISLKYNDGKKLVLSICENMAATNPHVKKWIDEYKKINDDLPCKIHDIVYKEKDYDYYKNRVELLVGYDTLTNTRGVGMRCGAGIAPLKDDLKTIPKIILPHIQKFEKFLNQSEMDVSRAGAANDGVWKHLSFKVGFKTNQILMIAGFQVSKLADSKILRARNELKSFYSSSEGEGITALFFQIIRERDKNGPSLHSKHVLGQQWIEEIIDGVTFKIKPQSDIPNCQWGAELINQTVRKLGCLNKNTVLIDVGSPLGTVSLCVAKDCKKCHYIEPKYIRIPSKNAKNIFMNIPEENNITNWSQSHAKVENILGSIVKKLKLKEESDVLMYFDPWCALRARGISTVKNTMEVNRLLFLTCGKKLMLNNFVDLVKPNGLSPEDTYVPVEAVSIDTYPHTPHMAVFILLERIKVARARTQGLVEHQPLSVNQDDEVDKNIEASNDDPGNNTGNTAEKMDSDEIPQPSDSNSDNIKTEANLRGSTETQAPSTA